MAGSCAPTRSPTPARATLSASRSSSISCLRVASALLGSILGACFYGLSFLRLRSISCSSLLHPCSSFVRFCSAAACLPSLSFNLFYFYWATVGIDVPARRMCGGTCSSQTPTILLWASHKTTMRFRPADRACISPRAPTYAAVCAGGYAGRRGRPRAA